MPVPVHNRGTTVGGIDIFYREAGAADAPAVLPPDGYPCSSYELRDYRKSNPSEDALFSGL